MKFVGEDGTVHDSRFRVAAREKPCKHDAGIRWEAGESDLMPTFIVMWGVSSVPAAAGFCRECSAWVKHAWWTEVDEHAGQRPYTRREIRQLVKERNAEAERKGAA